MLEVRNMSVAYGLHQALRNADLSVAIGEIVVILGANGAGKSSLLKAITRTSEGSISGSVRIDGTDVSRLAPENIVEMGIAFVPEGRGIFADLTVRENLELGAYCDRARTNEETNLRRVFDLFPVLHQRSGQVVRTMSGGEQQMVALGRAMMADPRILLLDEPSLGLSPLLCSQLFRNLSQIREFGVGVLLVEQNARLSLTIADRGYLLENGEISAAANATDLLDDPAVQAAYLGVSPDPVGQ